MYSSDKVIQIIGYLLSLNNGKMDKLKIMKELYLIDRESIDERHTSLSHDEYYNMNYGQVLSATLNMLNDASDVNSKNNWQEYIQHNRTSNEVKLIKETPQGKLSKKDKEYIERIAKRYQNHTGMDLVQFVHTLPEWKNPNGSSVKLRFCDIMRALGKTDDEIKEAKDEYQMLSDLHSSCPNS